MMTGEQSLVDFAETLNTLNRWLNKNLKQPWQDAN
jgi:hypothetical protein